MKPRIIGLHSSLPQSGKSTIARAIAERHGGTVQSIAGAIRKVAIELGMPAAAYVQGHYKDRACATLGGRSPRQVLIGIGEAIAKTFGDDVWVNALLERTSSLPGLVIIDDVRRLSEGEAIEAAGGIVVTVHRYGAPQVADVSGWRPRPGQIVSNNGTIDEAVAAVLRVAGREAA